MTWTPETAAVDAELDELGIAVTKDTRALMSLLASDPHALYSSLSKLSELEVPDESGLPPVDALVSKRMQELFPECSEPSVVRKAKPISGQCKRLLAILLRDVGTPVPLPELLLANGLRSATPRRLRELETEHGGFLIRTSSRDRQQHYTLERAEPDIDRCSRYWIRSNIRASGLSPARRVLALLSAEKGREVTRRDVDYVLPEEGSPGKGLARQASGFSELTVGELRQRGYRIIDTSHGFRLEDAA